jgi:hypothetical protein
MKGSKAFEVMNSFPQFKNQKECLIIDLNGDLGSDAEE